MSAELKTVAFVDGGEHSRRLMWSMLVLPYSIESGSSLVLRSEAEAEIARLREALEQIAALEETVQNEWDGVERVLPEITKLARAALNPGEQDGR